MNLTYDIALLQIDGIGSTTAKKLIAYCGSAEQVFREKKQSLEKIPNIGSFLAQKIIQFKDFSLAEKEIKFCRKEGIQLLPYYDKKFPAHLKNCEDSPSLLFTKGNIHTFPAQKVISIVGTRKITSYGKHFTEKIIEELSIYNPVIVSGLAYGVDIFAHKKAMESQLQTIGVLAHGLDRIYPQAHFQYAEKMQENGGLITEFVSNTNPDRENFPKRNRIVAGIADVVIVIESAIKGGSLITAELANSYNKDVFALPGKITDTYSQGCNHLIKTHKAHLIESGKDIAYIMGWELDPSKTNPIQKELFIELTTEEQLLHDYLKTHDPKRIDAISIDLKIPMNKLSPTLLGLEFKDIIETLPGKVYKIK